MTYLNNDIINLEEGIAIVKNKLAIYVNHSSLETPIDIGSNSIEDLDHLIRKMCAHPNNHSKELYNLVHDFISDHVREYILPDIKSASNRGFKSTTALLFSEVQGQWCRYRLVVKYIHSAFQSLDHTYVKHNSLQTVQQLCYNIFLTYATGASVMANFNEDDWDEYVRIVETLVNNADDNSTPDENLREIANDSIATKERSCEEKESETYNYWNYHDEEYLKNSIEDSMYSGMKSDEKQLLQLMLSIH